MALYVRFMFSLTVGLFGLGLVLTIVFDELSGDWTAARAAHAEVSAYFAERARRHDAVAERARRELERARTTTDPAVRQLQQRREELNELASVERKLQAPRGIVVTPLPLVKN
jgi:hypothetical protein